LFRNTASGHGVFGNFKSLLVEVCKSASMMYMLDLYSSTAAGPNENYARELCELHTLGAMNYAGVVEPDQLTGQYNLPTGMAADGGAIRLQYVDNDVYQVTSALSGWTISGSMWPYTAIGASALGTYAFDNTAHYKYQLLFLNRYIPANNGETAGTPHDSGFDLSFDQKLNEHLTPDTTITESLGHFFSQFLTVAGSALIDCDDRHGSYPPNL